LTKRLSRIHWFAQAFAALLLTLVFLASLGRGAEFTVKSVVTYGAGGAPRPHEFIAGDRVCLTSIASGLTLGPDGGTDLRLELELRDSEGEVHFSLPSTPYCFPLGLGEATTPIRSFFALPRTLAAGKYTIHFKVREVTSRQEVKEEIEIDVLDSTTFGVIFAQTVRDRTGNSPAVYAFTAGDTVMIGFGIVGYTLQDGTMKIRVRGKAVDEEHRPLGEESMQIFSSKLEPDQAYSAGFSRNANRAGNFKMHIEVEDLHSKKKVSFYIPFTVVDPLASSSLLAAERDEQAPLNR
jgi:hypothetical protein